MEDKYYLAFVREYDVSNGYYVLVLAKSISDAINKVKEKEGDDLIIDVQETIK